MSNLDQAGRLGNEIRRESPMPLVLSSCRSTDTQLPGSADRSEQFQQIER